MKISLLTGGADKPYSLGMLQALVSKGIAIDFIGNDEMSGSAIAADNRVNYLNLRGDQAPAVTKVKKTIRVLRYYWRLLSYVSTTDSEIFHILWLNKFALIDRVFLTLYYKLLGKKLAFTAHNIDEKERDGGNSILNRASLKIMYLLLDHIFVHTAKMKSQLVREFKVSESKISVIPFGINNTIPTTDLTKLQARARIGMNGDEHVLLFFGNIAPYKGLEYLLYAMDLLKKEGGLFRLIIAGQIKGCLPYWEGLERIMQELDLGKNLTIKIEYIQDEDVEVYFKSADVLVLPYKFIYQSGVLFLAYSFGLPVIATDVGSLRDDIVEGRTGVVCRAEDPYDLADAVRKYFGSELFKNLADNTRDIISYGNEKHSWDIVGSITCNIYEKLSTEKHKDFRRWEIRQGGDR